MPFPHEVHIGAIKSTQQALVDPHTTDLVKCFYSADSNFSGFLFTQLPERDRFSITAGDLFATSTLSIRFEAVAAKNLLQDQEKMSEVTRLLKEIPEISLGEATESDFELMSNFYTFIKNHLGKRGTKTSNRWVTASKLAARKRPELFPIRDRVVSNYLGIGNSRDKKDDWGVYRSIMNDSEVVEELALLRSRLEQTEIDQLRLGKEPNLRLLDVALWQFAQSIDYKGAL